MSSGLQNPQLYKSSALANTLRDAMKPRRVIGAQSLNSGFMSYLMHSHCLALSSLKPDHISTFLMVRDDF